MNEQTYAENPSLAMVCLAATTAGVFVGGTGALFAGAISVGQPSSPKTKRVTTEAASDRLKRILPGAKGLLPPKGRLETEKPSNQISGLAKNDPKLATVIGRMKRGEGTLSATAERTEVFSILTTHHSQSQPAGVAITAMVSEWDEQSQQANATAAQKAREVAEVASKAGSRGALWAFDTLFFGALVAASGGSVGARLGEASRYHQGGRVFSRTGQRHGTGVVVVGPSLPKGRST